MPKASTAVAERVTISPYQQMVMKETLISVRAGLLEMDPTIAEDGVLFMDMVDGESDALDYVREVLRRSLDCEELEKAAAQRVADVTARKAMWHRRYEAYRSAAFALLEVLRKPNGEFQPLVEGDFTASISMGKPSAVIEDEAKVPDRFCDVDVAVVRKPRAVDILAALQAGEDVPGAVLDPGMPHLTVRRR